VSEAIIRASPEEGKVMGRRIGRFAATMALAAGMLAGAQATPAFAGGAQVTRGEFHAFGAALTDPAYAQYQGLGGHAQMVRTADGKTIVTEHVDGLVPGTTYPSHVHNQACSNGDADGHYKLDPTNPGTVASNEIWPGPITADDDGVANGKTSVDHHARPEARSVVVHAPSGAKIGCADLT
jgi:Cu-Zn family superoxide dismutase